MDHKTENTKIERWGELMDQLPMVYKHNALVDAQMDLDAYENRILVCCISQIQKDEVIDGNRIFTIKASDVIGLSGLNKGSSYTALKEACKSLQQKVVTLPYGLDGKPLKVGHVATTVIAPSVEYYEQTATIGLSFAPAIIPYISQLNGHYTHYALADVMRMGSGKAMHLYEILIKKRQDQYIHLSLEQLRFALALEDKYPDYKDLKKRVIQPLVDEISQISPIRVKWDPIKQGLRKIVGVAFSYEWKDGMPRNIPPLPPPLEVVPAKPKKASASLVKNARKKAQTGQAAYLPAHVVQPSEPQRTDAGKPVKADGYKLFREQMQGKLKPKPEATTDFKDD